MAEHKRDVRNNDPKSGLSQHSLQAGHLFNFDKSKILERIDDQACRKIAEMFHVKLAGEENTVNLQRECEAFSSVYNSVVVNYSQRTETTTTRHTEPDDARGGVASSNRRKLRCILRLKMTEE
ncbi:uncharacterized protein LOC119767316 [Culex quinquefasciatus]|uniref:uncharacterized protein LOC119767316 n=1 Tax=Culex quinquefasciatus TaxID=7176 RepID=UPI0018E30D7E|nr:uncharacterized protein LOC119767316 [Culex quinquefasciatus]